ncbi:TonB-dependent siderophore receptor [Novosphingobium sp.]|uniref:TonB-dependent receptor plug domain-containing protein n=1 Tax=Novosphingobium sp. TaxID=1874826 RepID=UPI002733AA04|nr:TonB-dependent receptor [Novosphingobium sp.]MDP3906747.1 TonB-dependent receptor [Novosphingobium sp.]
MPRKNNSMPVLLAGCAFLLLPSRVLAQEVDTGPNPASPASGEATQDEAGEQVILVTGSRIKGAKASSDVTVVGRDAIVAAGQVDLGEATRALPQNFGGGQNPGVGTGAGLVNSNVNSASNVNLRGLGPDATLTLLNGHRLPYDSAFGGVDISAIPLAALDRIEVVPDGASAIYGSDAVAGVVNVILRRDFTGLEASAQLGASTDGGNFRQQADLVTGTRWSGGGMMLAYDYAHNSAISAGQRSYTSALAPENSLYPSQRRHAAVLSAHHDFGGGIIFDIDLLYAKRWSETAGGTAATRFVFSPRVETVTLAPSLTIPLGGDWSAKASGALGRDRTHFDTTITPVGGTASRTLGCYCNRAESAEIGFEGPLFALAGGDARLAFGGGYRNNAMAFDRTVDGSSTGAFDVSRDSTFAYGELFLPFVAPGNDLRGIDRLSLSAALRYENYPGMAKLATPRIGLIYAPFADLSLRGTWSRSFKAPSLFQQYSGYETYLLPAIAFGAGPAGTSVFYTSGGNPDLKPERARSWTLGFDFKPAAVPDLAFSATWFDVRYRDRVLRPVAGSIGAAFRDPGFASLIDANPDAQTLSDLIAGSLFGLENFSGGAYDPTKVVALLDNRNLNIAVQSVQGLDLRLSWAKDLGGDRRLNFGLAGSWLETRQQLLPTLPDVQLAGIVFNPPKLRVRASAGYTSPRFQFGTTLNVTGALEDNRFVTPERIGPRATVDLSAQYVLLGDGQSRPRLSLAFAVTNLFDDRPQKIRVTGPTDTPYDSTNYSPIGRFISFGIRGRW